MYKFRKNTSKTIGNNVYLTDDGKICYAINSLANTSLNVLEQLKKSGLSQLYIYGGENEITPEQHSVGMNFNLYNIDNLIQVKSQIEDIKKKIVIPNVKEAGREKKIYGQIVKILSDNIQYDEIEVDDVAKLSNRNLLSMLKGEAVCQGYIEVLRNISAEYGIQVRPIRGLIPVNGKKTAHEWCQVKLDGIWYDDDFTNYREALSKNDLDSCHCFLIGTRSDGIALTKYVGYETKSKLYNVGKTMSLEDKKILLSYGRVSQHAKQQSIQPQEKRKPAEESIKDEIGDEFKHKTQENRQNEQEAETKIVKRRILEEQDAKDITDLLVKSVENSRNPAKLDDYYIAANTGTSRKPNTNGTGYSNKLYASMIGYYPATNPKVVLYVVVDSPSGEGIWGSTVAAPVFKEISTEIVRILNLTPDKNTKK